MNLIILGGIGATEMILVLIVLFGILAFLLALFGQLKRNTIEGKLKRAQKLLNKKLITEADYEQLKARLISEEKI